MQQTQDNRLTNLRISTKYPPNYMDIVKVLGHDESAVYCYGDTIYNPHQREITADIEIHEQVHSKQQGDAPDFWCMRYLEDPRYRLEAELEAYAAQYNFINQFDSMTRAIKEWKLDKMAEELSSEAYGNIVSFQEARSQIRLRAKNMV